MPLVIIMVGLPASGKSTEARALIDATAGTPHAYRRVSKDDLRDMMDSGRYDPTTEKLVLAARDSIILHAITTGYSVVVDDTNIGGGHVERITKLVGDLAPVTLRIFDTPLDECIRRDATRVNPVGEASIRSMNDRWKEHRA